MRAPCNLPVKQLRFNMLFHARKAISVQTTINQKHLSNISIFKTNRASFFQTLALSSFFQPSYLRDNSFSCTLERKLNVVRDCKRRVAIGKLPPQNSHLIDQLRNFAIFWWQYVGNVVKNLVVVTEKGDVVEARGERLIKAFNKSLKLSSFTAYHLTAMKSLQILPRVEHQIVFGIENRNPSTRHHHIRVRNPLHQTLEIQSPSPRLIHQTL